MVFLLLLRFIGEQPHENDVIDAVLFQLQVEVGVREPTRGPVLLDEDVALPANDIVAATNYAVFI